MEQITSDDLELLFSNVSQHEDEIRSLLAEHGYDVPQETVSTEYNNATTSFNTETPVAPIDKCNLHPTTFNTFQIYCGPSHDLSQILSDDFGYIPPLSPEYRNSPTSYNHEMPGYNPMAFGLGQCSTEFNQYEDCREHSHGAARYSYDQCRSIQSQTCIQGSGHENDSFDNRSHSKSGCMKRVLAECNSAANSCNFGHPAYNPTSIESSHIPVGFNAHDIRHTLTQPHYNETEFTQSVYQNSVLDTHGDHYQTMSCNNPTQSTASIDLIDRMGLAKDTCSGAEEQNGAFKDNGCSGETPSFRNATTVDAGILTAQSQTAIEPITETHVPASAHADRPDHIDTSGDTRESVNNTGQDHISYVCSRPEEYLERTTESFNSERPCLVSHKQDNVVACELCKEEFDSFNELKDHLTIHTMQTPVVSQTRTGQHKDECLYHIMTCDGDRTYQCRLCSMLCTHFSTMSRHIRTHTGEKPYPCKECGKTFSQKGNLQSHIRTHTKEKPYPCKACGKTFSLKGNLQSHIRTHTKEMPYSSNECGKAFSQSSTLQAHMVIHTGDKPYKCKVCSKAFRDAPHLKDHIKTHAGDKPYKCNVCSKAFRRADHLRRHIRTHTGETPFKCKACSKSFALSSTLKEHILCHTGEKPRQCQHCLTCFRHRSSLSRHIERCPKE